MPGSGSENPHPPGTDISSQLFYPQEREQITEIDSTVVPWQARLARSHRDETSWQHNSLFRGIHACFFNLDVLLCFCILHPPAALENTRTLHSLAFPPSSHPLITPLQTRPQCPRLCGIREPHIWICDIRGRKRRQWGGKQRESLKDGRWIDGWRGDSQQDDRWDCRHRAVWHRQTVLFCCFWAPQIALYVTWTLLWTKYTTISQHRLVTHTHFETQAL